LTSSLQQATYQAFFTKDMGVSFCVRLEWLRGEIYTNRVIGL